MSQEWINTMRVHQLSKGGDQPFYNVLVQDGTCRYAAQGEFLHLIQDSKHSYDAILKIIILYIWCNRICWLGLIFKKYYFSNTVHYCRSSMPRLSQTRSFLQSPSFQQVQFALIGQLTQCIVIGRTPQTHVGNVTPFTIIASFSFQN